MPDFVGRRRLLLTQEATAGFEPAHKGFADPCLTTWLRRHLGVGPSGPPTPLAKMPTAATAASAIGRLLRAGDGIRTHDLLLGKETFYH